MNTPNTDQELAATEIADELMRPTKAPSEEADTEAWLAEVRAKGHISV